MQKWMDDELAEVTGGRRDQKVHLILYGNCSQFGNILRYLLYALSASDPIAIRVGCFDNCLIIGGSFEPVIMWCIHESMTL